MEISLNKWAAASHPQRVLLASGAPGCKYWQQRCDYDIKCELDEKNLKLTGSETVTYFNNSPNELTFSLAAVGREPAQQRKQCQLPEQYRCSGT
ncbi:MAG: hypothetical protein U0U70_08650 [Chitinophagaceae bacterium]